MIKGTFLSASVLALAVALTYPLPASANATQQVYPGCAVPAETPKHIWYIDPVNGSAKGDGSKAHPWGSLKAVFAFGGTPTVRPLLSTVNWYHTDSKGRRVSDNSGAPINPGDKILLMSGEYGDISIGYKGIPQINSDFVTVEAAPGQTPILSSLNVNSGTTKLLFSGLTVQDLRYSDDWKARVAIAGTDIIFTNGHIMTAPDISKYTHDEWLNQVSWLGAGVGGTCTSFTNNLIENVVNAVGMTGTNVLFANNTVRYWGWDGIDLMGGNNFMIFHNTFVDHIGANDAGDRWHSDVVQIFGKPSHNVVIDSNYVNEQTRADLPWPGKELNLTNDLHGFTDFGGDLSPTGNSGIVVSNNVVITNNPNGIVFNAPKTKIINNTVLTNDASKIGGTWILAHGEGTVIRNNIATNIIAYSAPNMVVDHNVVDNILAVRDGPNQNKKVNSPWYSTKYSAGQYIGDHNFIESKAFADVFAAYDPATYTYNLKLKAPTGTAGNPAIGMGSSIDVPALDITGTARKSPYNLGAYEEIDTVTK